MTQQEINEKNETWLPVPGFIGEYEVSTLGNARSITKTVNGHNGPKVRKGRLLKQAISNGYLFFKASSKNISQKISIHRMVATLFVDNPDRKPTVNHKDGIKTNNHYKNLEWATHSEQTCHAIRTGLYIQNPPPVKLGDKLSMETRRKMSESRKGRIVTESTRVRISESLKRRQNENEVKG